jgi:hypothetical protein
VQVLGKIIMADLFPMTLNEEAEANKRFIQASASLDAGALIAARPGRITSKPEYNG